MEDFEQEIGIIYQYFTFKENWSGCFVSVCYGWKSWYRKHPIEGKCRLWKCGQYQVHAGAIICEALLCKFLQAQDAFFSY